MQIIYLYKH